jgi:hypothetical protein
MFRVFPLVVIFLGAFPIARSQPAGPAKVAPGSYECWANGQARMLLNFTIKSGTQYTGSDGKPGSYSYALSTGRVMFKGGSLDGAMPEGFTTIYHEPKGRPTVSFRSARGAEASFCQLQK